MSYLLIVDDYELNRELLQIHLESAGYSVKTAHSGEQALDIIAESQPLLVILDIYMQGISGLEVCSTLKNKPETKTIPVILIVTLDHTEDRQKALDAGADSLMTKPFDSNDFLEQVQTLLLSR